MSLLGLDIVDKLSNDLQAIERRRITKQLDSKTGKKIHLLEKEIETLQTQCVKESEALANKSSEIDSLEGQIRNVKQSYKNHGGELYEQRELIEKQHHLHEQQLKNTEDNIRNFAEGAAPLQLVRSLIERAQKQSEKEYSALINRDVIETLEERDLTILSQFVEHSANNQSVELLNKLLADDREFRKQSSLEKTPLNVRPELLIHFDKIFFSRLHREANQLKESYEHLSDELATSDRLLSTIPEADMIKQVAQQLKSAEDNFKISQGEQIILQNIYNETANAANNKQIELDRLLHRANDEQLNTHRSKNIVEHTREVRHTLDLYHKALIGKHIGRLEALIKESFSSLIRKKDLIHNIKIDPESFSLYVVSQKNEIIPTKRLSAGERQLLAISILWGLAKASGRPLPAIIDTPLGRLDSEHRGHLIDNYFPNASHQVILLSTDTEIDNEYRNALSERIGKEYHIQYHEDQQTSTITPGYF